MGLQALITPRHFDAMAKIMLMAAIVMGLSYASEWFAAWYGGNPADRDLVTFEFTGAYAKLYWAMLFGNVIAPQILWLPVMRTNLQGTDRGLRGSADRNVARAHLHRLEHAVAQLSAVDGSGVLSNFLGLAVSVRTRLLLRLALSPVLPGRARRANVRRAGTRRREAFAMSANERLLVIAEFRDADDLCAAARNVRSRGFDPVDALTPCPGRGTRRGSAARRIADPMADADRRARRRGAAYAVEFWTAVYAYPINSGGRPLNSWPIFLLVPFEVGVLAAALAGFAALLVLCGLPRLHHPLFDCDAIERATNDRYFLLVRAPPKAESDA